ncbi:MAG: transposase [Planctomycetes bacterium]|nr:transposase [Planctomycetota bacterium]MCK5612639.1 transposase [Candidatus Pacearchaeota archaeon]
MDKQVSQADFDRVGHCLRELIWEICKTNDIEVLQGHISRDHVHVLLSCSPNLSASKIMQ